VIVSVDVKINDFALRCAVVIDEINPLIVGIDHVAICAYAPDHDVVAVATNNVPLAAAGHFELVVAVTTNQK